MASAEYANSSYYSTYQVEPHYENYNEPSKPKHEDSVSNVAFDVPQETDQETGRCCNEICSSRKRVYALICGLLTLTVIILISALVPLFYQPSSQYSPIPSENQTYRATPIPSQFDYETPIQNQTPYETQDQSPIQEDLVPSKG